MNSSKQFLSRVSRDLKTKMPNLMNKNKNSSSAATTNTKKQPEASIVAVDSKNVSRQGVTLVAKINVHNPYMVPIPICQITFSLKTANREIVTGQVPDPGSVKARGNTLLDTPVKVPYSVLMSLVQDVATDWDVDYVLDLGLVVDVPLIGNITIPLSYKGVFKLPTFSEFLNTTN